MASIVANIAKGREVELYNRVLTNDPTNSALVVGILVAGGDSLSDLQDYDTIAAMLAGPSTEAAVAGYARQVLDNTDLFAWAPDDTLNRTDLFLPTLTFSPDTGETWDTAFVAYDNDTTGGTDANLIPISYHEIRIEGTAVPTVTGSDIIVDFSFGWILSS